MINDLIHLLHSIGPRLNLNSNNIVYFSKDIKSFKNYCEIYKLERIRNYKYQNIKTGDIYIYQNKFNLMSGLEFKGYIIHPNLIKETKDDL